MKVKSVAFHRNGVSGKPFYVMLAKGEGRDLVIIRPYVTNPEDEGAECYVLDIGLLAEGNIKFGENSFRGDVFQLEADRAISNFEALRKKDG